MSSLSKMCTLLYVFTFILRSDFLLKMKVAGPEELALLCLPMSFFLSGAG